MQFLASGEWNTPRIECFRGLIEPREVQSRKCRLPNLPLWTYPKAMHLTIQLFTGYSELFMRIIFAFPRVYSIKTSILFWSLAHPETYATTEANLQFLFPHRLNALKEVQELFSEISGIPVRWVLWRGWCGKPNPSDSGTIKRLAKLSLISISVASTLKFKWKTGEEFPPVWLTCRLKTLRMLLAEYYLIKFLLVFGGS